MGTFLDKIKEQKLKEVENKQNTLSYEKLEQKVKNSHFKAPNFINALKREGDCIKIIGEIKPKAPGRDTVSIDNIDAIIKDYNTSGIKALSILTDASYFGGSMDILAKASTLTDLPILNKEFIVSKYQILEAKLAGASAVLILIYYYKDASMLNEILDFIKSLDMDAVVECSEINEIPYAIDSNAKIIMINNRDITKLDENPKKTYLLGDVKVSLDFYEKYITFKNFKNLKGHLLISASAINTRKDVKMIEDLPFDAVLIGNSLMLNEDRSGFVKQLLG